ncbi:precorrin-2 dehydrogenase/sirohydrochlorin ferrochelatase family protein [Bacillus suaedae]|uniref:precorrin-2 dehydrogenase n=1 Tax=Halalkalibacter suaedae TaxID=2822140 RepID=A0A940WRV7_9BACI|nr:bifunctional precorrin-2 dehydrogenase/sirohydrochlorin ferrochelatase [Bacillus suaedae]MBP3951181.1 bifunctional precorrin-2 dehydrogenase/sirohydrochlorin ferrochelatase [Bacillus suaedae]
MKRLPIMLKLEGKTAAVVGAGKVAARHIPKLLSAGIKEVMVYSPSLDQSLAGYHDHSQIIWIKGEISERHSFDTDLLLLTSTNHELHQRLLEQRKPGQLIYLADDPVASDIHFPITITRGELSVALSTNGSSPTYAKQLKEKIEECLTDEIEGDLIFLDKVRRQVQEAVSEPSQRKQLLRQATSEKVLRNKDRDTLMKQMIDDVIH